MSKFVEQEVEQSNQLSTGVTEVIVETIEKVAPNADLDVKSINHISCSCLCYLCYIR
jgi:hypothetical protein